jgi:hypothetical protein
LPSSRTRSPAVSSSWSPVAIEPRNSRCDRPATLGFSRAERRRVSPSRHQAPYLLPIQSAKRPSRSKAHLLRLA